MKKIKEYLKKLINILKKPEMRILPANIAFNIILAIIPLLTIIVLIASYFDISIDLVTNLVSEVMPNQVSSIIIDVISGKGFDGSVGFFNITAFILASNGTYAIINTSNTLYQIKDRDYLKDRISSVILLFIIIILFLFLLIVPIFGDSIIKLMANAKVLSNFTVEAMAIFNVIKWPVTLLIIYLNVKLIYTVAPSKNVRSEETTYGSLFTTLGWILGIIIFKFYLAHFARYDIVYGNLAAIIILMVWTYFLSYIFIFGMAINVSRREEIELEETMRIEREKLKEAIKKEKKNSKKQVSKKKVAEKEKEVEVTTKDTSDKKDRTK